MPAEAEQPGGEEGPLDRLAPLLPLPLVLLEAPLLLVGDRLEDEQTGEGEGDRPTRAAR